MRHGFNTLAAQAGQVVAEDPYSGHMLVLRGRRGDLLKIIWWDRQGACLFCKRLERGRFVWPACQRRQSHSEPLASVNAAGRDRLAYSGGGNNGISGGSGYDRHEVWIGFAFHPHEGSGINHRFWI